MVAERFCDGSNTTGPFPGTIVCAPSAPVFLGTGSVMFYAGAGGTALTAAWNQQPSWVTAIDLPYDASTNQIIGTIGVDAAGVSGVQMWSFTIGGEGLADVSVSVTLSVS